MALSPFALFPQPHPVWIIYGKKSRLQDGVAETDPYKGYSVHHMTDN